MLSQYDAPEGRALFNSLKNVAGKTRSVPRYESVGVPEGIEQVRSLVLFPFFLQSSFESWSL